jgi:hypothetical protein
LNYFIEGYKTNVFIAEIINKYGLEIRKMKKKFILMIIILGLLISGCMYHKPYVYQPLDTSDKSITVPVGSAGPISEIKHYLKSTGWKTKIYGGPTRTQGEMGKNTNLKTYDTFMTRYTLFFGSDQYDWCFNLTPAIRYELSVVDNKSGEEAFTVNGKGCEGEVVEQFKKWAEKK